MRYCDLKVGDVLISSDWSDTPWLVIELRKEEYCVEGLIVWFNLESGARSTRPAPKQEVEDNYMILSGK